MHACVGVTAFIDLTDCLKLHNTKEGGLPCLVFYGKTATESLRGVGHRML